jgi:alpha-glucosidase (family GH31 glycosyl hydrolase)
MIMDMDWHKDGWTGWSWNTSLIPDPKGLINWMHQHNMKVSLNLHPADGVNNYEDNFAQMCADLGKDPGTTTNIPWQLEDYNFYKAIFKNIIRLRESEGVDFWWIDWQQRLTNNNLAGLGETFWCNHVFYEDMRLNRPEHRPVIFHRWGGLGSHRYPIGFSGDTFATFPTLAFQPYFTATASNVGFGYWGHDLGGHQQPGDNDPELYLRWMQFGVFTPIFRTHATNAANIERRIWVYENFPSLLKTVQLRYAMFPYIYTAAREAYDTGVSMCRPLYYDHPEDANAYKYEDEYMFGNDILVAPIVTPADADKTVRRTVWLPEGKWWNVCRSKMMDGNVTFTDTYGQEDIPYFYKAGSIIVNNPPQKSVTTKAQTLILKVVPGADGSYSLYEDEGDTELYKDGVFSRTEFTQTRNAQSVTLNIGARTGVYPGMPDERAYRAEFIGSEKPERVLINGNEAASGTWSYDSDNRTVTVNIPTASCDVATAIELRYAVLQSELTGINGTENGATSIEYNAQDGTVTAHLAATAKNAKLEIVSANGSETCTATGTDCNSINADISSFGRGTYVCRIIVDGKSVTRKIVK